MHLTPSEVERVIKSASRVGRHGSRDAALVQVMYRHGLRVSELVALIGTIRRECLDWLIPMSEGHLRAILREWIRHYNCGLSLIHI